MFICVAWWTVHRLESSVVIAYVHIHTSCTRREEHKSIEWEVSSIGARIRCAFGLVWIVRYWFWCYTFGVSVVTVHVYSRHYICRIKCNVHHPLPSYRLLCARECCVCKASVVPQPSTNIYKCSRTLHHKRINGSNQYTTSTIVGNATIVAKVHLSVQKF